MVEELLRGMVDVDYFETTNELLEHLIINLAESKTAQCSGVDSKSHQTTIYSDEIHRI